MTFTVAIAGRPNVGKSTLFNRLVGKQMAIVDDTPGVTRDWREGDGHLYELRFRVIDTAGLEDAQAGAIAASKKPPSGRLGKIAAPDGAHMSARTAAQTRQALQQADIILFIVDARAGATLDDGVIARELRKTGLPIILLANKCEGSRLPASIDDIASLGFGEPLPISAAHGDGMMDLREAIAEYAPEEDEDEGSGEKHLIMAVVGRPNAGKSTLINHLVGSDRMLTGPEPGLTRDAIPISWDYRGTAVRLVDTAGMRRRAKVTETLERASVSETIRAIRLAHVVILVLDATMPFDKQDLIIAHHVVEEGRALVIALNKWDLVQDRKLVMKQIEEKAEVSLAQISGVALMPIVATRGKGLDDLMAAALQAYETWNIRVSTGKLNRWLEDMEANHPPPITQGRRIKLRYATQVKSRPPTFSLWVNKPVDLPESYQRFLTNGLRQKFDLKGVPIRWQLKKSENPYENKTKR